MRKVINGIRMISVDITASCKHSATTIYCCFMRDLNKRHCSNVPIRPSSLMPVEPALVPASFSQ